MFVEDKLTMNPTCVPLCLWITVLSFKCFEQYISLTIRQLVFDMCEHQGHSSVCNSRCRITRAVNLAVKGELGRFPISFSCIIQAFR